MNKSVVEGHVTELLKAIEGDLRDGTADTPNRVYRSYLEIFDGYDIDIPSLFTSFDDEDCVPPDGIHDQIVAVRNIEGWSVCEHHMLPFSFNASVAYLPKDKVIGASKIPRLVMAFAHRLQIQERITRQVANAIMTNLDPYGVAVIIRGQHLCMQMRGVKSPESQLVTSVMSGVFRDSQASRMEVLELLGMK